METILKKEPDVDIFYLSRGHFGLGEFVALDYQLQETLLSAADTARNYIYHIMEGISYKRPINFYLEADPGSGKSYLVKQIYQSIIQSYPNKASYLDFNISNISSPHELFMAFKEAASLNNDNKLPIIFFDEIDTEILSNEYLFKHFLTPMYNGIYYDQGRPFKFGNAIFFFAGSRRFRHFYKEKKSKPLPGINKKIKKLEDALKSDEGIDYWIWKNQEEIIFDDIFKSWSRTRQGIPLKLIDFLDRVDSFIFIPPLSIVPNKDRRLQALKAALIVTGIIHKQFPNVTKLELAVQAFLSWKLLKSNSVRDIESIVIRIKDKKNKAISRHQLPRDIKIKFERYFERYDTKNDMMPKWTIIDKTDLLKIVKIY